MSTFGSEQMDRKSMGWVLALVAAGLLMAAPAFAQFIPVYYRSNVSMNCSSEDVSPNDVEFLTAEGFNNRDFIAFCNGIEDPNNPVNKDAIDALVEQQAVIFDRVDFALMVIDKCTQDTVCTWHTNPEEDHGEACASVDKGTLEKGTRKGVCTRLMGDLEDAELETIIHFDGAMYCKEYESWDHTAELNVHRFTNKCHGYVGVEEDFPCQVKINSNGVYEPPKSCDMVQ